MACGNDRHAGTASSGSALSGQVSVFAASSLTDAFDAIGDAFTQLYPGVDLEFNNASSSALATQIEEGAPASVFASADVPQMQRLVEQGLIEGTPQTFARNRPVVVVPAANPAQVTSPRDLAKPGIKLVLASEDVPIGNYARQIIEHLAGETGYGAAFRDAALANLVSNESNVRAVLTKIELGEADAGIVYRTDALVAGDRVTTIEIADSANVVATYPIGVVADTEHHDVAAAFVAFVLSPEGEAILGQAGFDTAE